MITIGVPTKNRPILLERTLASLLGVLDSKLVKELIILDGSRKVSSNVKRILRIIEQHIPIRYILSTDIPLVRSRRKLLELCRTPYLYSFDDDIILSRSTFHTYPFDPSYAFICPRIIDLWYMGFHWFEFPESTMLLPYTEATKRVPLKYINTGAVLLDVDICLQAGVFTDKNNLGEYLEGSARLHKVGKMGLYEPKAIVYHCLNPRAWRSEELKPTHPYPEEFVKYIRPNPQIKKYSIKIERLMNEAAGFECS